MSRRAQYHIDARFAITAEQVDSVRTMCTPSGKAVYIDESTSLRVHTLKGVVSSLADVLMHDSHADVCEIGRKIGSFDGSVRWRIAFCPWNKLHEPHRGAAPCMQYPGPGRIAVEEDGDYLRVIATWYCGGIWAQAFPQLRYRPVAGSRVGVFMHQWKCWFGRPIPGDEARAAADVFDALPAVHACDDIVALNRMASSMLYDLAVSLGWRKLTLKEKRKYGLVDDAPQWQRVDCIVARLVQREGSTNGCGKYTNDAAAGRMLCCPQCEEAQCSCT